MKKYRIVLKNHPDVVCSGYYTYKERAIKRCNELNNLNTSHKYSVKEYEIINKK